MNTEAIPIPYLKRGGKEIRIGSKVRIPEKVAYLGSGITYPLDVVVKIIYEEWDNKMSTSYYGFYSEDWGPTQFETECGKTIYPGENFEKIEVLKF